MFTVHQGNFLYTLGHIRQRLFTFLETELAGENIEGITPSYGDILYLLEKKGSVNLNEISRLSMKDKSTITNIINHLERNGYIIKVRDSRDRRIINVQLTEKAAGFNPAMVRISRKMNQRLFNGLSEEEKSTLFGLLTRINQNVENR